MVEGLASSKLCKNQEGCNFAKEMSNQYETFLIRVGQYLFSSFFEGANFIRRATALEILTMLLNTFVDQDENNLLGLNQLRSQLFNAKNSSILVRCLEDAFETNKVLALSCLNSFPRDTFISEQSTETEKYIVNTWKHAIQLMCSYKPPETVSAAYILPFLVEHFETRLYRFLSEQLDETCNIILLSRQVQSKCKKSTTAYCLVLDHLMISLKHQMKIASGNLIEASEKGPMYGTVFCLRSILKVLSGHSLYIGGMVIPKNWFIQVIEIMMEASNIVSGVVNNDSPEGHLPMDFTSVSGSDSDENDMSSGNRSSSQKLLLCAWRTSKDVSLLLGDLCALYNKQLELLGGDKSLLIKVTRKLAYFFSAILSEIKHRGAFEQAYIGFCQVCSVLWHNVNKITETQESSMSIDKDEDFLNPVILLKEALECLNPNATEKNLPKSNIDSKDDGFATLNIYNQSAELCITRRSAGIPYLIQGENLLIIMALPGMFHKASNIYLFL